MQKCSLQKKQLFLQKSLGRRASKLGQCLHRGVAEKPILTRQRSVGASQAALYREMFPLAVAAFLFGNWHGAWGIGNR